MLAASECAFAYFNVQTNSLYTSVDVDCRGTITEQPIKSTSVGEVKNAQLSGMHGFALEQYTGLCLHWLLSNILMQRKEQMQEHSLETEQLSSNGFTGF